MIVSTRNKVLIVTIVVVVVVIELAALSWWKLTGKDD